jgi:hypothetical protein
MFSDYWTKWSKVYHALAYPYGNFPKESKNASFKTILEKNNIKMGLQLEIKSINFRLKIGMKLCECERARTAYCNLN